MYGHQLSYKHKLPNFMEKSIFNILFNLVFNFSSGVLIKIYLPLNVMQFVVY